jgi:fibronectin type 3 domain-containing protein
MNRVCFGKAATDTNGLESNTRYYYRVRATNGTTNSDYSNEPSAVTLLDAPVEPSNLTITSLLSNKVSLSWSDNSGVVKPNQPYLD